MRSPVIYEEFVFNVHRSLLVSMTVRENWVITLLANSEHGPSTSHNSATALPHEGCTTTSLDGALCDLPSTLIAERCLSKILPQVFFWIAPLGSRFIVDLNANSAIGRCSIIK